MLPSVMRIWRREQCPFDPHLAKRFLVNVTGDAVEPSARFSDNAERQDPFMATVWGGGVASLHNPDELGEAFRIGAQRLRLAVIDDATLVENRNAWRERQRHAAVLFNEDDRERAFRAQLGEYGGQRLDEDRPQSLRLARPSAARSGSFH